MSAKNVRSGQQGTDKPWKEPGAASQDPSLEKSRPTEDDLARKHLGGTKGDGSADAPMTEQRRKKTFPNEDPGHVA